MRRLLVVALLLPACWTWSFPESLLQGDADAGLDAAAGQAGQSGTPDAGLEAGLPGGVGGGAGGSGGGPNACRSHEECPAGLCTLEGMCAPEDQISYVAASCEPTATGTRSKPVCSLAAALTSNRPYVLVANGTYDAALFDSPRQVYGLAGATLRATPCDSLTIQGAAVALVGFSIAGNVVATGAGAKATLVGNSIGPSSCTGVHTRNGASLVMDRNLVHGHSKGGVSAVALFDLTNNIIVGNGAMNSEVGGAQLSSAAGSRFLHNTVSNNKGSNRPFDAGGVECAGSATLVNSIIWGNTNRQLSESCLASSSLQTDPLFEDGPPDAATSYKLQLGSPAINKGSMTGLTYDYFGATRVDAPDLGAVEFIPP